MPIFQRRLEADINESCDDYMTVNFTDTSVGATAWEWDVDGDDIVDYTDQNPLMFTHLEFMMLHLKFQAEVKASQKCFLSL